MEPLFQAALDLILDGSLGTVSEKKAPVALRAAAAVLLAAAFCALAGFCIYLVIKDESWYVKAFGAVILLLELVAAFRFFTALKKRNGRKDR